MATKAAAEKPKTYHDGIDENGLAYKDVPWNGVTYRLRQVTVTEADEAWDAATDETTDKTNYRINSRLGLAASIVSPKTSLDDIGTWPNAKLGALLEVYDRLGSLRLADTEGN